MTEQEIPEDTDLSQVPKGEKPYLKLDGHTKITNLLGDKIILKGIIRACQGFANKKFDHFKVVSCPAYTWEFIFQKDGECRQKDIVQELLVAGYTLEIQREKIVLPHIAY